MNIKHVCLHTTIFLAGKNFGDKLDPSVTPGLKLEYDRAEKELIIEWQGRTAIVPVSNIASLVLAHPDDLKRPELTSTPEHKPVTAQVGGPQHHVFQGPGAGKTK